MLSEKLNIYEYEEILLGQKLNFTCSFKGDRRGNEIEVGNIWRYAITKLLKWTPQEALQYLTRDLVKKLLLDKTYVGIDFDETKMYLNDYRFILQYAFPNEVQYDFYQETITEYEKVAKIGKWANDKRNFKYQKKFFIDANGFSRAKIILNHVIRLYLSEKSDYELYEFFSKTDVSLWFKEHSLSLPLKLLYKNDGFDFFHESFERSNNIYYYNKLIEKRVKGKKRSVDGMPQ